MKSYNLELLDYLDTKNGSWARSTINTAYHKLLTVLDVGLEPNILYKQLSEKGYTPYTIKTYFVLARQYEEEIKKTTHFKKWLSGNKLVFKNAYKRKDRKLTKEQFERYLELCPTVDYYNFLILIGKAGLRKSEAFAVTLNDIRDGFLEVKSGKGGKQRFVPFDVTWLKSPDSDKDLSIIPSKLNVQRFFKEHVKEVTPHDFRAYYATQLSYINGISIEDIRDVLGHEDITTTARYLRADKTRQKRLILGE